MRRLSFAAYPAGAPVRDTPSALCYLRCLQALLWPSAQAGDREHRRRLADLTGSVEDLGELKGEGEDQRRQLRPEGGDLLVSEADYVLLGKCLASMWAEARGFTAAESVRIDAWYDDVPAEGKP